MSVSVASCDFARGLVSSLGSSLNDQRDSAEENPQPLY